MSTANSNALFGAAAGVQPAAPGTYGQPPQGHRLPDGTALGAVHLQVAELERSISYYEGTLGLRVTERAAASATLAAQGDDRALLMLHERAGARPSGRGRLGLYHFAILLPDRPALARFVRHLAEIGERAGAGDHLVSEAFYLTDPDGLGIEVYVDRPREQWQRLDRELVMATDPVDVADLLQAAGDDPWTGMPAGTVMGHVHLHVGNLEQAGEFFSEGLGFDRTVWRYPGALFLGAGGYHHHVGANTWAGAGARPPADEDARLLEWTIELPDAGAVDAVAESLARGSFPADRDAEGALMTRDPWGTAVRVRAAARTSQE